jgi:hypothetical protein
VGSGVKVALGVGVKVAVAVAVAVGVGVGVPHDALISHLPAFTITRPQCPLCMATEPT